MADAENLFPKAYYDLNFKFCNYPYNNKFDEIVDKVVCSLIRLNNYILCRGKNKYRINTIRFVVHYFSHGCI